MGKLQVNGSIGLTGSLLFTSNNVNSNIWSQNSSFLHYSTDATNGHWFNKKVYVQGDIACGPNYQDLVLSTGNYNSYVPSLAGSGAYGTWGINITGNAATATTANSVAWGNVTGKPSSFIPSSHTHNYIEPKGIYTFTSSTLPNSFDFGISCGFVDHNAGFGNYGSVLTVRTYNGGGGTLQLYAPYSPTYGGTHLKARFGNYDSNTGNSWTSLKEIAWLSDLNSYLPLSGGTMTGSPVIKFPASQGSIATSDPMAITYGRISAYGTLCINADSDGSTDEYLILTSGRGLSSSAADGLAIGYNTLTWQNNTIIHSGNIGSQSVYSASYSGRADTVYGPYSGNGGNQVPSYIGTNTTRFAMMRNFGSSDIGGYMDCILMNNYSWSDVPYATGLGITKVNGYPRAIIANGPKTGWAYATELVTTYNYSWWCVPLSGGTMSGNLNINTHGNTMTIGSLNSAWCHFQSSADIPFYFNRRVFVDGCLGIYEMNSQGCGSSFPSSPSRGQIFFKI